MDVESRPVHGGLSVTELESLSLDQRDVLDFSASINPLGPSPTALEAIGHVNLAAYPDPDCTRLRQALAEENDVGPECIVAGNGSTELIHLLARASLGAGDNAAIFGPTFSEYEAACRMQSVNPAMILPIDSSFEWDTTQAVEAIVRLRPRIVFLCNPNNPTGTYLGEHDVTDIARTLDGLGLLVVDEAYVSFADARWNSLPLLSMHNVAILRSMTKDYALTGLRLGYLLSSAEIANRVRRFQYSWSVNSLAQVAGLSALDDPEYVVKGREVVREGKEYLRNTARSIGVECPESAANFLLMRIGRATEVRRKLLLEHGVCVRDCTSFGLPDHIRIGVRTMDDNRVLGEALRSVLNVDSSQ